MKKYFNKNLIMNVEEYLFQQRNDDDEKVRDHSHVTGKFREAGHRSCNINFQLTKKIPVIFHNLKGYDSHLIFFELNKFDVKINVIPNGLEKYIASFLNKNLVFIDSMQFMNSSLDKLVKNLSDEDFKYLVEEFGSENLEILKQKSAYPYEYMNNFERFTERKVPPRKYFFSSAKKGKIDDDDDDNDDDDGEMSDGHISIKNYLTCEKFWINLK